MCLPLKEQLPGSVQRLLQTLWIPRNTCQCKNKYATSTNTQQLQTYIYIKYYTSVKLLLHCINNSLAAAASWLTAATIALAICRRQFSLSCLHEIQSKENILRKCAINASCKLQLAAVKAAAACGVWVSLWSTDALRFR